MTIGPRFLRLHFSKCWGVTVEDETTKGFLIMLQVGPFVFEQWFTVKA